jgi:hypothetical protein
MAPGRPRLGPTAAINIELAIDKVDDAAIDDPGRFVSVCCHCAFMTG